MKLKFFRGLAYFFAIFSMLGMTVTAIYFLATLFIFAIGKVTILEVGRTFLIFTGTFYAVFLLTIFYNWIDNSYQKQKKSREEKTKNDDGRGKITELKGA